MSSNDFGAIAQAPALVAGLPGIAHPTNNATVARLGDDPQARRVLVLATSADVTVTWNGSGPQLAASADVTGVHSFGRQNPTRKTARTPRAALSLAPDFHAKLNAARLQAGQSWPAGGPGSVRLRWRWYWRLCSD